MERPYYDPLRDVEGRLGVLESSHPPGPCESQEERDLMHQWAELRRYEFALWMSLSARVVDLLTLDEPVDMRLCWSIAHSVYCNMPYCSIKRL